MADREKLITETELFDFSDVKFADDEPLETATEAKEEQRRQGAPWKVLIVDDEEDVHTATRLALRRVDFQDRPLELLHARSAADARRLLEHHADIAMILLDVIMESDDAGLELVKYIRRDLANPLVRIILRTGQAAKVPEREVITTYDINDYKTKTELTADKLYTAVIAALRGYRAMEELDAHKRFLEEKVRLRTRELRVALDKTFKGGIKILIDVLSVVSPEAFMRSRRLAKLARRIGAKVTGETLWQLEVAALLSQVGCVAVPYPVLKKVYAGGRLSEKERQIYDTYASTGKELIANIPNLRTVAELIGGQTTSFPPVTEKRSPHFLPKLLKALNELDLQVERGQSEASALRHISHQPDYANDAPILDLLHAIIELGDEKQKSYTVRMVSVEQLPTACILLEDVTSQGVRLIARGTVMSDVFKTRLRNWKKYRGDIDEPIKIAIGTGGGGE
jgi:response regulator RpfG family c-di-GMP phosphodiesterase